VLGLPSDSIRGIELQKLAQQVRLCTLCGLHASRTNAVPGSGPADARIMIVGEAPGANEDLQGLPFVGAAGKVLDNLLAGIGLSRDQVYVTNVLKCRPPHNRDPSPEEAETCLPYLRRQFGLIRPQTVVILGRHALERMLPGVGSISRVHGETFERAGVQFIPCYHPAAALHNGSLLKDLEADFQRVKAHLDRTPAEAQPGPTPKSHEAGTDPAADIQLRLI